MKFLIDIPDDMIASKTANIREGEAGYVTLSFKCGTKIVGRRLAEGGLILKSDEPIPAYDGHGNKVLIPQE